jgi:hypothetical protein
MERIIECPTTKYSLELILDPCNQTILLNNINTDYKYPKALMLLLTNMTDEYIKKEYKYITQYTTKAEYIENLQSKTTWKIRIEHDDYIMIYCDISDFPINMALGFGLL